MQGNERKGISADGCQFLSSSTTKVACQKFDKKQKTSRVTNFDVSDDIMAKAQFVHEILVRTAAENDLISAEACYHASCLKKLYRVVKRAETMSKATDMAISWLCQELRHSA